MKYHKNESTTKLIKHKYVYIYIYNIVTQKILVNCTNFLKYNNLYKCQWIDTLVLYLSPITVLKEMLLKHIFYANINYKKLGASFYISTQQK